MRILYDHQVFSLQDGGGISRYYFELTRALDRLALSTCDIFTGLHRNRYSFQKLPHTRVWQCRARLAGHPGAVRYAFNQVISDCLVPICGTYDVYHPTLYRWLGTARYRRMVVTHHDCTYERYPSLFSSASLIMRMRARQFAKADAIICPSASSRQDLHHFYDVPEEKTFVVHHGVAKLPADADETPLRSERPFLLYVGSRAPYKNFSGLLSAFAATGLQQSFDLVAVGGGPAQRHELEQINQSGLSGRVRFMPDAPDATLAAHYRQAHLLVYPSLYEGFGFPPLEAMLQGCPVLAAGTSCLPEICGAAAFLFAPDAKEAFVEALRVSCGDEDKRRKAVALGRNHAENYSWEKCARTTLGIYDL